MFHYVGVSWMIETQDQYNFELDEEWCTRGPLFIETVCQNIRGPLFE